ncbi:Uncharacterised protein [Enterococcus faecalis]|uniref:hypothetical protein n=1 Tax=Enterococcus faecalis TaxID=1351 RepID=UPI000DFE1288|nr:hypothetical protein [Enterococcus faecalis]STP93474.1 Uncharacterised protein [Enterococcus faecalis]
MLTMKGALKFLIEQRVIFGNNSKENGLSEGNIPTTGAGYPIGKSGKPEGGGGHINLHHFLSLLL